MEKELEKVKGALDDFGKKVVEAVKKGKGGADKVAKTAQVKIEIGSLKRQQKDLYQELGELFYKNFKMVAIFFKFFFNNLFFGYINHTSN